jgi:hypothetical protein
MEERGRAILKCFEEGRIATQKNRRVTECEMAKTIHPPFDEAAQKPHGRLADQNEQVETQPARAQNHNPANRGTAGPSPARRNQFSADLR